MTKESLIDKMESSPTDVPGRFQEIRDALDQAQSREDLTELYKRSVHMIMMTHSSPIVGDKDMIRRRETAEHEFTRTIHMINQRAKTIGVEADYSEDWKKMEVNGYETEGKNLLEAQEDVGIVEE